MSTFFKQMIDDGSALVYIDDILLMSNSKEHMINLIKSLHEISKKKFEVSP